MKKALTIELLHQIEKENTVELTDFFDFLETVGDLIVMRRVLKKVKDVAREQAKQGRSIFLCVILKDEQKNGSEEESAMAYALARKIGSFLGCMPLADWIDTSSSYTAVYLNAERAEYRLAWLRWMGKQLDLLEEQYRGTRV